jgi:hypothetical protein
MQIAELQEKELDVSCRELVKQLYTLVNLGSKVEIPILEEVKSAAVVHGVTNLSLMLAT